MIKDNDNLSMLIKHLKANDKDDKIVMIPKNIQKLTVRPSAAWSRDRMVYELQRIADNDATLRGKERADVLCKIADLLRLKEDEKKEEIRRVHYYLPLTCNRCALRAKKSK